MSFALRSIDASCTAQARIDSPLGSLLLARTARGLAGIWFEGQAHHPGLLGAQERPDDPLLRKAASQLADYFAGRATRFDVPLDLHGTAFQRNVWRVLQDIAPGCTRSYGEIARALGTPLAVRAVGAAVGRNPVSIVVPCHRVIGSGGALTGYAGGIDRKRALLALEGVAMPRIGLVPAGERRVA